MTEEGFYIAATSLGAADAVPAGERGPAPALRADLLHLLQREGCRMNPPEIEDFTISTEQGWNGAWLECPTVGCNPESIDMPVSISEAQNAADRHIRASHLPPLPEGHVHCAGCYNSFPKGRGFWLWCQDCAQ